ncbi:helix-turn-helix domain-containing protein [Butyricicoccus sp. AM05-1]|uniref:helix-turn-helix domain-containing protein n=1 Tax=Butyricicoccus sp. AM05-1 TaxID=2292004 RepID=UPI000E5358DA|nr:helix-turn-helix domain-containing protein [Butyricicoccus sp. AM05-1]RHO65222.1 helix-turn-helix domain-containing protein [Butyricicoccus sp. AM05-1]
MEQIGKRLRELREGSRLTQTQVAEVVGVQQSRINRYESGKSTPPPEVFVKYADFFDVSMDYLYCRTDKPQGRLYNFQPKVTAAQAIKHKDMKQFVEMCFDPKSPVSKRMKETLLELWKEQLK